MSERERVSRAYCASIGADPDEMVNGYSDGGFGVAEWIAAKRWRWYVGAAVHLPVK